MVPPDCLEPVLKAIINNFVTERNSSEVMAVGLNAVRELCARYCRVFVQIFPTPSDCQVSSCDDWRSSEGSSRVWDVCTRTKPWWLIALSFTATWNSFHIDKFDAGERCDWGREQSICSTSWQRSVGEGNCRKCCQGALCQGGLRVWRHRQCYLVLLMMYIWFLICFCVNNVWISSDHDDQARQFATLGHVSSTRSDATGALQHHRRFLIFFTIFCTIHVFFMCFSKLSFLYFIFCIGHNLIHFRKGCVRTKKIVRVVKIFQLFT